MASDPVLRVEGLRTEFATGDSPPAVAVNDLSFEVNRGETLCIVGESGCGKSLTALSVLRLLPRPYGRIGAGRVLLEGRDLVQVSDPEIREVRGRAVSMIFQEPMTALSPVHAAELARRALEQRALTPLVSVARDWMASRTALSRAAYAVTAADAKVGDVLRLNVNANVACTNADTKSGRVAAVGTKSIIVSDTDNPTGGYTDTEYAAIAATFDTLVFPMDTTAFGAPSNISSYGKIILFYTRAVNALTPSGAGYTIGGFFFARDLYPKMAKNGLAACAASNESEMFYLLAPDPNGTVNTNKRTKDEVTLLNLTTIAHELQHLINSSRRLYVNTGARPNEETWLDEGLAHVAE